ncbi:MAG: hypothetical protein WC308_01160 [archaeon]|jgi:hypothetical protein
MSSRGYLFTISVILFVSTLVFYSQQYVNNNSFREQGIIFSSKLINQPFLNDDIGTDLQKILGFAIRTDYNSDLNLLVSGVVPRGFGVSTAIVDYNSFLYRTFFERTSGVKSIDLSSLADGKAELSVGSILSYDFDYSNSSAIIYPKNGASLNSLDINIDASASDLNRFEWVNPVSGPSGTIPVRINYTDDVNSFSVSTSVNSSVLNKLAIVYQGDENAYIIVGQIGGVNSSVDINANSLRSFNYSIFASYSPSSYPNNLPIFFDSILAYSGNGFDSNSLIKISG